MERGIKLRRIADEVEFVALEEDILHADRSLPLIVEGAWHKKESTLGIGHNCVHEARRLGAKTEAVRERAKQEQG